MPEEAHKGDGKAKKWTMCGARLVAKIILIVAVKVGDMATAQDGLGPQHEYRMQVITAGN
jgi:hypothetical protein